MDMKKFTDKILKSEDLKDIPAVYVFRVSFFILNLLKDRDIFYEREGV